MKKVIAAVAIAAMVIMACYKNRTKYVAVCKQNELRWWGR